MIAKSLEIAIMQLFLGVLLILLAAAPSAGEFTGQRFIDDGFAGRSAVHAPNAMVATSQPLATQAAIEILHSGGSAVDAAIAANAVLTIVDPAAAGIGGDLFALVWDPLGKKLHGLNASGRSPAGMPLAELKSELGDRDLLPMYGPLTVTVPGAIDGWFELHKKFGRLPMAKILAPAIRYAREGVPIPEYAAWLWHYGIGKLEEAPEVEGKLDNLRRTFLIDGKPPTTGQLFRNPDLAATYELLAVTGRDVFYRGEIAKTIVDYLKKMGGKLQLSDLRQHRSSWVTPVSVNYRGYDVFQIPPNGQGMTVLQMLNILEGFDIGRLGYTNPDYWHVLVESKKLAFEDRARYYADPNFENIPVKHLLSKQYAKERRAMIDMDHALKDLQPGDARLSKGETTILAVGDSDGMMISLIQSQYWFFGSGLVPDGLGFPLQNRGSRFALEEDHANVYAPGKRPFHTIIPGFVMKDGDPWLAFGVLGASAQPQGQVQVLVNLIDFGMNVQAAGDAARMFHTGSSTPRGKPQEEAGGRLYLERAIGERIIDDMRWRGHNAEYVTSHLKSYVGGYQGVIRDPQTGAYSGAAEMRLDGRAAGY
jgi:gamma-glutamyltranspeptidase/glutathione hydrolase